MTHSLRRPVRRTDTPNARAHALIARMMIIMSLVFGLAMGLSHVDRLSRSEPPASSATQP
jgi:hypothetical protein